MFCKKMLFGLLISLLALGACSKNKSKDNNPLSSQNAQPQISIIGFAKDTLVYVDKRTYPFELQLIDERPDLIEVKVRSVGGNGQVAILDSTAAGRFFGTYMPFRKGKHLIEVQASDKVQPMVTKTFSVVFADNQAPKAVIEYRQIERDLTNVTFTYEFNAVKSQDKDGTLTKATWHIENTKTVAQPQDIVKFTFNRYAVYTVRLTVEDDIGAQGEQTIEIDNMKPQALLSMAAEVKNSEPVLLDASKSHSPNGSIIGHRWLLKDNTRGLSIIGSSGDSFFEYTVRTSVGANQFGLVIEDDQHNFSDTTWVTDAVTVNWNPTAHFTYSTSLERLSIDTNNSFDQDPYDTFTYSWLIDGIRQQAVGSQAFPQFDLLGGFHDVTLIVTDQHGGQDSLNQKVSIPGKPVARVLVPEQVFNGDTLSFDGSSSDEGHESAGIANFLWFLRKDGFVTELGETLEDFYPLILFHTVGTYEIGLQIKNIEGLLSSLTWQAFNVVNSNPIIEITYYFDETWNDDYTEQTGEFVQINQNNSRDPDPGQTLSYYWYVDCKEDVLKRNRLRPRFEFEPGGLSQIYLVVVDSLGGETLFMLRYNIPCSQ